MFLGDAIIDDQLEQRKDPPLRQVSSQRVVDAWLLVARGKGQWGICLDHPETSTKTHHSSYVSFGSEKLFPSFCW